MKKLFLLSFFLLFLVTTQCMKTTRTDIIEFSSSSLSIKKPKTLQELQNIRNNIIKRSIEGERYIISADLVLFQEYWCALDPDIVYFYKQFPLTILKDNILDFTGCSFLALIAISVKNRNNLTKVPFSEKKERIQAFRKYGIAPTIKDKEFALLEKWEEYESSITQKINNLQHSPLATKLPREVINYIGLLIFDTEESLL